MKLNKYLLHSEPSIKLIYVTIIDFQNTVPRENIQNMKKMVDEEYRNWISLTNEAEASSSSPLFFCLVYRMLLETENVSPYVLK